ncbi:MAG: fimbrillin family protein, partial [Bacteroidaceae bacterium]|nr:fimbrillin family protein [Bacteroidaceae bacterium]
MKKFFTSALAFLSLFAIVACSEEAMVENPSNGELKKVSITGKDFQYDGTTRSSVNITESGASFIWSENDTVGIFPNTGSQAEFAMSQGAGTETATFSGGGWALKSSATYAAYYPYNFYNRDLTNIPVSYEGQTQNGNASTTHIGAYDFMAASVSTPENGAVSFDMQHLGCLVQLTVDLDEAATINEVSIKYGEENSGEFITKGYIDLSSETPAIQASSQEDKSNTISIALENLSVIAEETATVYFMMAPVNLEGKTIDVTVTKDNDDTKTYKTAGKNFIAGKAYAFALTNKDVLLTYNLVDLGLPSGTLWADRNVGADSPEDYGDYFAWGETTTKSTYNWSTYNWCRGSEDTMTKYCTDSSYGTVDNKTVLDLEDDAAYVNMGAEWRMPTYDELNELYSECTWTWTTQSGTDGYMVTGPNGNSIFLPATGYRDDSSLSDAASYGYYWLASLYEGNPNYARPSYFDSGFRYRGIYSRCYGLAVRAVAAVKKEPNKVDLGLPSGTLWADRNVGADSPEDYGDYFA